MAAVNSRDNIRLEKRSSRRAWCTFSRHFLSLASTRCAVAHVQLRWRRRRRPFAVGENFLFSSLARQLGRRKGVFFSGKVYHPEPPHAQSLFLFPIVFGFNYHCQWVSFDHGLKKHHSKVLRHNIFIPESSLVVREKKDRLQNLTVSSKPYWLWGYEEWCFYDDYAMKIRWRRTLGWSSIVSG